jgi:hypothetical protein
LRFGYAITVLLIVSLMFGSVSGVAQASSTCENCAAESEQNVAKAQATSKSYLPISRLSGLNAGLSAAGVHDSSSGWYSILTPFVSYAFSPHYSSDVSMSLYPYRYIQAEGQGFSQSTGLVFVGGDVGDVLAEAHALFDLKQYRSLSTASMTLPTGNRADGLGTGRVTFNLEERVERYFGRTGLVLGVGGGDSSGLQNRLVEQDDTALGPLAQFQTGIVTWLPKNVSLQSVVYEQLPIGDQKNYSILSRPGFPATTVVTGRRVNEDNGFTTTIYIPLTSHLMLTSSYNRSLRLHLDTASTGVTFVFKGLSIRRSESVIDRAMREAESGGVSLK